MSTSVRSRLPCRPLQLPAIDREREMYDALVMALRDYMRKTGFTRAIVAVSGGIDSALALAIAVDALGPDRVSAYNLPSQFNSETTRSIACRLATAFGVPYGVIPIQDIDENVRQVFETHAHPITQHLTRENLHARIRGLLMMAEVQRHRRAAGVVRQRNGDRPRLCHALRRHVRRDLVDWRSVEDGRVPPGPPCERSAWRRADSGRHVPDHALRRTRGRAIRPVRLPGRLAGGR